MFHIGDAGEERGRSGRYSINDISPTQAWPFGLTYLLVMVTIV